MKKILIINGHPDKLSFCTRLSEVYRKGAKASGFEVKLIHLADLKFNPILEHGYRERTEFEPCLQEALIDIKEADHLVWVYPNWWGTYPALLKGFIDRIFLPGLTFQYRKNSILWDKLLKNKSARLLVTMDTPKWYYMLMLRNPGDNAIKKSVLQFCGINPVKITHFTPLKSSTDEQRKNWLAKAERLGQRGK